MNVEVVRSDASDLFILLGRLRKATLLRQDDTEVVSEDREIGDFETFAVLSLGVHESLAFSQIWHRQIPGRVGTFPFARRTMG